MRLVLGSSRDRVILAALILELVLCSSISRAGEVTSEPGAETSDAAAIEYFEKSVRPILVARCQGCHGAVKQKGGFERLEEELRRCLAFLRTNPEAGQAGQVPRAWADLCHLLMNVKAFIYID